MAGYYIPLVGTPQIGDSGGGGGGAGGLLVNVTHDEATETDTCDKTAGEMAAVIEAGGSIVFKYSIIDGHDYYPLTSASIESSGYYFSGITNFEATSANDYPTSCGK